MEKHSILNDIDLNSKEEIFSDLLKNKNVRIERIVSTGQTSPKDFWYDQDENEFVLLLEGEAILEFKEEDKVKEVKLNKNDYIDIKAHVKHRVKYTDTNNPTIWLAVFY
ncbi:cupin domain-containing protein [Arcobacter roscoffensis]|uniref:Cupin domain-containing protein n=1 Tax=Arcobacter roscoffensis TaxID=2961520 RepID=A0ABY5E700_9BACT|nr:cupin domain-containing protein [Arcobacter roscoffensis]UTJ06488.1 cupin domain-containing protein [Arcobacter roscoffensis]